MWNGFELARKSRQSIQSDYDLLSQHTIKKQEREKRNSNVKFNYSDMPRRMLYSWHEAEGCTTTQ